MRAQANTTRVRIELTAEQERQRRQATDREAERSRLRPEVMEERAAPRYFCGQML